MEMKRVVVTGLGCLTPIGNNIEEFWDGLMNGVSGSTPITRFDTTNFKTKFACQIQNFNAEDFIDKKEIRKMDLNTVYAMVAAGEAVTDSGITPENADPHRCGVIFTSGIGGLNSLEHELKDYFTGSGVPRFNPFYITKMITNMPAGMIAIKYGFMGANFATVSACASSNHAIISAYNCIRTGQ
ncbi:MAG: beta-ketoacyl-[Bacteroidales bacterium]|nr:beta-ketoacyl-[acyl-carrier-protein] synthase II [Bacteroidales bacterium]